MNKKCRYWSLIFYPESCPFNWKDLLEEMGACCAVSPLHDKDTNPDGTIKKPHYHLLIQFPGPTTYNYIKSTFSDLLNGTIPQVVISLRGYYRYLVHHDNPEKFQYDLNDIITLGGFELSLTATETTKLKSDILLDIISNNIKEYSQLCIFYQDQGDLDKFELVCNNTMFFSTFIRSYRFYSQTEKKVL